MHEAAAVPSWVLLAYLISGVCFILALRGLSSPDSSRRGNLIGMAGMTIAVVTTLATHQIAALWEIGVAIVIGGAIEDAPPRGAHDPGNLLHAHDLAWLTGPRDAWRIVKGRRGGIGHLLFECVYPGKSSRYHGSGSDFLCKIHGIPICCVVVSGPIWSIVPQVGDDP